jgi:preprotein translocase subunit YajC
MDNSVFYSILSLIIIGSILISIKLIEREKFKTLSGSHKATGVIIIILCVVEIIYLSLNFKLLSSAIEIVTSLSAFLLFFTFIYLNKLQNAISGLSISLGNRIKVGQRIEFEGNFGKVTQIGLTKTIIKLEDSERIMLIPNKKFDEEITILEDSNFKSSKNFSNQKQFFKDHNKNSK